MFTITDYVNGQWKVHDSDDNTDSYVTGTELAQAYSQGIQIRGVREDRGQLFFSIYRKKRPKKVSKPEIKKSSVDSKKVYPFYFDTNHEVWAAVRWECEGYTVSLKDDVFRFGSKKEAIAFLKECDPVAQAYKAGR